MLNETSALNANNDPCSSVPHRRIAAGFVLARVGSAGTISRFSNPDRIAVRRNDRVVCRSGRGLELGIVLIPSATITKPFETGGFSPNESMEDRDTASGKILRRTTPEDELLWGHLQQLGEQAFASCESWLKQHSSAAVLLEVEPLLDGRTLYFHFMSEVEEDIQRHLDHLVSLYERQVRRSKFAKLVEHGCGPGCGTSEAKNGCGTGSGCAVCKIASVCDRSRIDS